jgi:RNA polymerase sigma-70 factor (ECF subfamily)
VVSRHGGGSVLTVERFEAILAAAQSGVPWGFERLYRTFASTVFTYLRLQGAHDPEDLTSEVFLGAFSGIGSFEGGEVQFRAWLLTIAHRRLVDYRRRAAVRPRTASAETAWLDQVHGGNAEEDALRGLELEDVRQVLDSLTEDQRQVLLLRIVGELTVDQVAEAIGKPATAVKALQRRGLQALRRQLATEVVSP